MKFLIYIILSFLIVNGVFSQTEKKYIRRGNIEYNKDKFDESEIAYRKAVDLYTDTTESYKASFNLGDALYKQQKYPESINQFKSLANQHENKEDRAKVYHNLGNSYLLSGEIEKSIDSYKNALRNNPADMETKYNLAYAQHLLKQQQNQKNQDQQNQDQQNKEQNQDQQQQEQKQDENKENQDQQQQQQQENQMSKEDMERMLQALENDEKDIQEKVKKAQMQAVPTKIEKDW
ncbi:MAG: tetratricopeptide repeat protein [Bacteroidota bacterium]